MSYVENNLSKNENVIKKAVIHWFIYAKAVSVLLFSLFFLGEPETYGFGGFLLILSLAFLIEAFITMKTTELAVTSKRVIAKHGLISRKTIEINLNKVEGLNVNQSIIGRIFNFGDVIIGGTGGKKSPIKYIKDPLSFRRTVNEQIED